MIDELATLDQRDAVAVLDLLDARSRDLALALLNQRAKGPPLQDEPDDAVSDWLRNHILSQGAMTRMAHDALAAASRVMVGAPDAARRQRRPGPSLLSRMGSSLSRKGAS